MTLFKEASCFLEMFILIIIRKVSPSLETTFFCSNYESTCAAFPNFLFSEWIASLNSTRPLISCDGWSTWALVDTILPTLCTMATDCPSPTSYSCSLFCVGLVNRVYDWIHFEQWSQSMFPQSDSVQSVMEFTSREKLLWNDVFCTVAWWLTAIAFCLIYLFSNELFFAVPLYSINQNQNNENVWSLTCRKKASFKMLRWIIHAGAFSESIQ